MNLPENLTLDWLRDHAQQHLVGGDLKWTITAWHNVIYLKIRDNWTPEETEDYVNNISTLPSILRQKWDRVFLVFDLTDMVFRTEDAPRYLRSNWLKTLDQEDLSICLVNERQMRRILWRSLYALVGKLNRIRIFASPDEALAWVHAELAVTPAAR